MLLLLQHHQFFDNQRNQWKSNDILQWLSDKYRPSSKSTTKTLALCDFDAYSGHLNFVSGEAYVSLFYKRIVKEAVHSFGDVPKQDIALV
jgi:predicted Zn-dependent protease